MSTWGDRWQQIQGKTRWVVCRIMLHLAGREVVPLLGILNRAAQQAIESEGDLRVLGADLVDICQALLQYDTYWRSIANEGDSFWQEGEAESYVNELFTDSAQRYRGSEVGVLGEDDEPFTLPVSENLVVMLTIAYSGEASALETDLSQRFALQAALKTIINLHYQERLAAIQVHYCPARFGDQLTEEQLLLNFPELIPL